jgi:hypothetical protein
LPELYIKALAFQLRKFKLNKHKINIKLKKVKVMKKVSRIKKLVVAAVLLFGVGAEVKAQNKVMRVYHKGGGFYQRAISEIDSVVFLDGTDPGTNKTHSLLSPLKH